MFNFIYEMLKFFEIPLQPHLINSSEAFLITLTERKSSQEQEKLTVYKIMNKELIYFLNQTNVCIFYKKVEKARM